MNLWISDLKEVLKAGVNFNIVQLWNTHTPLKGLFMANVKLKVGFPLVLIILRTLHFYTIFWFLVCAQIKHPQRNFKKYILFFKQSKYYVFQGGESLQKSMVLIPVLALLKLYFKNNFFTLTSLNLNIFLHFSFAIGIFLEKQ